MSKPSLRRLIAWGILTLLAVMPFHAFISVWLESLWGHMQIIQGWKEMLLALMTILAGWLCFKDSGRLARLKQPVVLAAGAFALVALLVTLVFGRAGLVAELVGAKTDLEFLLAFVLAILIADNSLESLSGKIILITGGTVSILAVVQAWVLPADFLRHFGYGPATIMPFETISQHVRVLSTLGGPNQLGSFLILPIAITVGLLIRHRKRWPIALLIVELFALYYSFSRSAWLGAAAAILLVIVFSLPRKAGVASALVFILALSGFGLLTHGGQDVLLHGGLGNKDSSDAKHLIAAESGLKAALSKPLGRGMGSAGPASYYSSQPLITENYYLQLAVETGLLGLVLFIAVEVLLALALWPQRSDHGLAGPLLAALAGMAIVNLFLHGWADSSTALVYWLAAGLAVGGSKHGQA